MRFSLWTNEYDWYTELACMNIYVVGFKFFMVLYWNIWYTVTADNSTASHVWFHVSHYFCYLVFVYQQVSHFIGRHFSGRCANWASKITISKWNINADPNPKYCRPIVVFSRSGLPVGVSSRWTHTILSAAILSNFHRLPSAEASALLSTESKHLLGLEVFLFVRTVCSVWLTDGQHRYCGRRTVVDMYIVYRKATVDGATSYLLPV